MSVSSGGQDDSSSEEAQTNTHKITNTKPVVPPRPRGISGVEYKRNGVPNPPTTNGKPAKSNFTEDVPCKDNDVANADCKRIKTIFNRIQALPRNLEIYFFFWFVLFLSPVSSQLISNIISQLMVTTNSVMQLHQRLKNTEESSNGSDNRKQDMLKELENAVMMTQSMLTKITTNKYALFTTHFDSTQTSFRLPNLIEILSSLGQQIGIVLVIMSHLPRNRMVNTHR